MKPEPPLFHHPPVEVTSGTWLIRHYHRSDEACEAGGPMVPIHSALIRGREPVVVDTGALNNREAWLADLFELVEPDQVRWVFLSHADSDHFGNLEPVLERCTRAMLVTSRLHTERLSTSLSLPRSRCRWIEPGESLRAGDRELRAVRLPLFDSPSTLGLLDGSTGFLWSADAFGCLVSAPVVEAEEMERAEWEEGLGRFALWAAPWLEMAEPGAWNRSLDGLVALDPAVVVPTHGPVIRRADLSAAVASYRRLAGRIPQPLPARGPALGVRHRPLSPR